MLAHHPKTLRLLLFVVSSMFIMGTFASFTIATPNTVMAQDEDAGDGEDGGDVENAGAEDAGGGTAAPKKKLNALQ